MYATFADKRARADTPAPRGCFDSSWDLKRGLDVVESVPAHLMPAEWRGLGPAAPDRPEARPLA